jgi:hypothetical protein
VAKYNITYYFHHHRTSNAYFIQVTEEQLKSLLEQVSQVTQKKTTVKFDRRRHAVDSDDDDI